MDPIYRHHHPLRDQQTLPADEEPTYDRHLGSRLIEAIDRKREKRHEKAREKHAGGFRGRPDGRTIARWTGCTLIAGLAVYGAFGPDTTNAANSTIAAPAPAPKVPGQFAAHCLELYMSAGGDEPEHMAQLTKDCNPSLDPDLLAEQEANRFRGQGARAHEGGWSYPVDGQPNTTSHLISVHAAEWVDGQGDAPGRFADVGTTQWWRVAVHTNPETLRLSMVGAPYRVPPPTDPEPPARQGRLRTANLDEPRTAAVQNFLSAWMPATPTGREGQASIAPWIADGAEIPELHAPDIADVIVTHTAFYNAEDGTLRADVMADVETTRGGTTAQMISLEIVQAGNRYVVGGLPGAPAIDE